MSLSVALRHTPSFRRANFSSILCAESCLKKKKAEFRAPDIYRHITSLAQGEKQVAENAVVRTGLSLQKIVDGHLGILLQEISGDNILVTEFV